MLAGIDLRGKVVMDAATGAGNTTVWLAQQLHAADWGRIISIDKEPDTFPDVKQQLGDLTGLVEFIEADLTNMPQIADASIDIIVCHATICAVNDRPLNAVNALSEFHRTLTGRGLLIIVDEYPLPITSKPDETVQVQRWQLYKAVAELVDGRHYTEIYPEELIVAAQLVGFQLIDRHRVEGTALTATVMEEWRDVMPQLIRNVDDDGLRHAFTNATKRIWNRYRKHGGVFPPLYVLRLEK